MDKGAYITNGVPEVPMPEGQRTVEGMRAYRKTCDARAEVLVDKVAPRITALDFAEIVPIEETRGMAMVLAGDSERDVSRKALSLEMHQPQAYWERARQECGNIVHKHAVFAQSNGDPHGYFETALSLQDSLDDKVMEANSPKGGVQAMNLFASVLVHPGVHYDEKDRKTLAAHALVHARIANRDAVALKEARKDLPEAGQMFVDMAVKHGLQSEVMGAVRSLSQHDKGAFVQASSAIRDDAWNTIQASAREAQGASPSGMDVFTNAALKGTEKAVQTAAATPAGDQTIFVKNREAVHAMMGHSLVADGPYFGLLAVDLASRRVEARERATEQVLVPKKDRAIEGDRV